MTTQEKLTLAFVLGVIGFVAFKKFNKTKTVYIDTLDTPMPNIVNWENIA